MEWAILSDQWATCVESLTHRLTLAAESRHPLPRPTSHEGAATKIVRGPAQLALHREQYAGLRGDAIDARDDGLVAIRDVRGHIHIELIFSGCDVQPGESN